MSESNRWTVSDWLLLLWALLVLGWAIYPIAAHGQTRQLSAGQPFSSVYLPSLPQATSSHVVYVMDAVRDGAFEVYSVGIDGGTPVRISQQFASGQSARFAISPAGERVVFLTDGDVIGKPELYSTTISGGSVTRISKTMQDNGQVLGNFKIGPVSGQVYYAADSATNNVLELFRVPVAGGASVRVNRTLPSTNYDVFEFKVAALAGGVERVVYRSGRSDVGGYRLYSAPSAGTSAQAVEIGRPMVVGGGVDGDFKIAPSGSKVVYLCDAEQNGSFSLYVVATTGGTSLRLNADPNGDTGVRPGFIVTDSTVTYQQRIGAVTSWFSVSLAGGAPVAVSPPVAVPVKSPDGVWTLHEVGTDLRSSRSGVMRSVNCPGQLVTMRFLGEPVYSVSPDSKAVLFVAGGEVFAGPISGAVCELFRNGFESGTFSGWIAVQ